MWRIVKRPRRGGDAGKTTEGGPTGFLGVVSEHLRCARIAASSLPCQKVSGAVSVTSYWLNGLSAMACFRFIVFVFFAALVSAGCSLDRVGEARLVLEDIDVGGGPSELKAETPAPFRDLVHFSVSGRSYVGDLYTPRHGERAGLVLVPGVAATGKDDARMVAFAATLARAHFRVLVPDLANLRALKVKPEDAIAVADAALWLDDQTPDGWPLGIAAISYAVGPAIGSLFEPGVNDRVDLVLAIGGYYDLPALITYFTTGHFRDNAGEPWRTRQPNTYGKWVFVQSNVDRLDSANDQALLRAIQDAKIRDERAPVQHFVDVLGPEGRAVYALIVNKDPEKVSSLIAALPEKMAADLQALDMAGRDLKALKPEFFLVHGRDDPIVPESQSAALAAALPAGKAHLFLTDSLNHVDPQPVGLTDKLTLLRAIYGVLSVRDGE